MGVVVRSRKFSSANQAGLLKPIIYCCPYKDVVRQAVPINAPLAQVLLDIQPQQRTMQMEKCLAQVVAELPDDIVICDFDVMFNPAYQIDVLNILVHICKIKPFDVLWPGRIEGNRLIYAQAGYPDYKSFDINHYDVTCIV